MSFSDFVSGIRFRLVKPHTPLPPLGFDMYTQRWLKFPVFFEMFNTRLPDRSSELKQRLRKLCFLPKMSTFAIAAIINQAVEKMPDVHAFVNVGTWHGFTLLAGMAENHDKTCIGVDNFSDYGAPKNDFQENFNEHRGFSHHFHEMDYIDYFSSVHHKPIGVYIYDGDHSYENQLRGLQAAEPYFSSDCIILIDDANYEAARRGTFDFVTMSHNEYRVLLDETTFNNCHPTLWNGLTILQRIQ